MVLVLLEVLSFQGGVGGGRSFRHPVLLRGQGMDDGAISQQCFLDPMLVQVPLRQRGFFTYSRREGRTGDQKTTRRFYRWNDLRSRRQQLMAETPQGHRKVLPKAKCEGMMNVRTARCRNRFTKNATLPIKNLSIKKGLWTMCT